jgi:putative ubiquitin-RnfH superfamily antitoxin RatB of RatAB toxin-antitoxin module
MLADAGYVRWDRADERIERGDRFDVVRPLVAFHANRTEPQSLADTSVSDAVD